VFGGYVGGGLGVDGGVLVVGGGVLCEVGVGGGGGGERSIGKLMHTWKDNIKIDPDKSRRICGPIQEKGCWSHIIVFTKI